MFEVSVRMGFSAAHRIPDHPGKCSRLHGHNYNITIYVRAEELDELGMVCDFYLLKKEAGTLIEELDHTCLNDHPDLKNLQTTCEMMARYFFGRLQPSLDANNHWLHAVRVSESERSSALYIRDDV